MPGSNREIVDLFFKDLQGGEYQSSCGVKRKQAANKSVTNLMSPLQMLMKIIKKLKHRKADR